jgi:DMSO/TMAO reductase YedYZ molybdopterin-dependent catalytic subunit
MEKIRIWTGALVGLLVTMPLVAVLFLGEQLAGLPFVPFDVLDWMPRALPGGVVTFAIDRMVDVLVALRLSVADTSKTAEYLLAVGAILLVGVVAGAALFGLLRARKAERGEMGGMLVGLIVAVPMALIGLSVNPAGYTAAAVIWVMGLFLGWGAALGGAYDALAAKRPAAPESAEAITVQAVSRREFLIRLGGATAAITVVGAGLGGWLATRNRREETAGEEAATPVMGEATPTPALPNADDPVSPAPGTRPELTPVDEHFRLDIVARPPIIDGASWTLPITGLVDHPLTLTLDDLRQNYEPMDDYVTIACISNPVGGNLIGTTRWTGVSLRDVLADAGVQEDAGYLIITGADGFSETVSLNAINNDARIMLVYDWDGRPLPPTHGFPLRVFIPDLYGMKQPKWIVGIEVVADYEEGFWVARGWDEVARVRTASAIDTVAANAIIGEGDEQLVPIGGIAYSGARGIATVEIQVDDGEWVEAQLRSPLSDFTWVIWRYDWPFAAGPHTFRVRCTDGTGAPQIERESTPHPSGATGIHEVSVSV